MMSSLSEIFISPKPHQELPVAQTEDLNFYFVLPFYCLRQTGCAGALKTCSCSSAVWSRIIVQITKSKIEYLIRQGFQTARPRLPIARKGHLLSNQWLDLYVWSSFNCSYSLLDTQSRDVLVCCDVLGHLMQLVSEREDCLFSSLWDMKLAKIQQLPLHPNPGTQKCAADPPHMYTRIQKCNMENRSANINK